MSDDQAPTGPDLTAGVDLASLEDGKPLAGQVDGEAAILVRKGDALFAIGASCSHYGAPLADGLVVGDTLRCPWHHACFDLRTGEALRAPALDPVACWRVEQKDGKAFVREKIAPAKKAAPQGDGVPRSIVIVGGGAAGNAAAEMLRREGYAGTITMLSADSSVPDRPNLSKSFLAGSAPEEYAVLRTADFYREHGIDLRLETTVTSIDTQGRTLTLADGTRLGYDGLLLATGAKPIRLDLPGADLPHVHTLRSLADSKALVAAAAEGKRAVVIGASFIGLEVAASLRARKVHVDVVAPEAVPMAKVLGPEVGTFVRHLHEGHGVTFHLGTTPTAITASGVVLQNGETLPADLVVLGVGVRPELGLAEKAGLAIDRGVTVDEYLETSVPGIFAAGDIARWPDRRTGERIRVEHWVVAERQGQTAARNLLGRREPFDSVPFFWTDQYDFTLAYVGHAERWDEAALDGTLSGEARDCTVTYRSGGKTLAVATVYRDQASLRAEAAMEVERAPR